MPWLLLLLLTLSFLTLLSSCTQQDALFCPNDGCAQRLSDEIYAATSYCHVAIAYFTHEGIARALIDAHERGVDVKVLGEGDENRPETEERREGINYDIVKMLELAGVPYRDDSNPATMHHKFTVVDGQTVVTGSFNYTNSADTSNNENLVILTSPRMALAFEDEFERLWSVGVE